MLSHSRRNTILKILNEKGQVTTQRLEEELKVSGATIRNDLAELEQDGLLKRIHGGAILEKENTNKHSYRNFHKRSQKNIEDKKSIGEKAADIIEDENTLLLDASSTILYLIPYLKDKNKLTIVTNGLYTALEAKEYSDFNVLMLGGIVRSQSGALEGLLGESIISKINADIMLTSAYGFSLKEGLTDFNFYEVELKKRMVEKSKKLIALLDHTKIGHTSAAQFADTSDIDIIITDKKTTKNQIEEIKSAGIKVLVAD